MLCLGARPRYSLVVDEDVKKPTKQTNKAMQGATINYGFKAVLSKKHFSPMPLIFVYLMHSMKLVEDNVKYFLSTLSLWIQDTLGTSSMPSEYLNNVHHGHAPT